VTALNVIALDAIKDVPGAPMPLVEREVRFTAIDFCDYTLTWRVELNDANIVDGTAEYTMTPPADSRIATVLYASANGIRLLPTTERRLDDTEDGWRLSTTKAAQAQWYYLPDRTTIRIALTPSENITSGLGITVALKPTQDAKTLPDQLYEDNLEALRAGTLARLLSIPAKEWSNPDAGLYYRGEYERAKRKEKAERLNDYTRSSSLSIVPGGNYGGARRRNAEED